MNYSEYPGHKTYVVQHTTGFGDQGGEPTKWLEIIGSYDTYAEAMAAGLEKFPRHPSGWTYHNFDIHVNYLTKEGKLIKNQRLMEWELMLMRIHEHPERYETVQTEGFSLTFKKNAVFDSTKPITPALENYRFLILDTDEELKK